MLQKNVTFQNLGNQVLKKRFPNLVCQVLKKNSTCSWQGSNVESLYPEKFQDLESQVLNSAIIVKTSGHGVARKCNISKLGKPSLEKNARFHNCGCQVLKNISKCVHVLEDQVMKDIILGKGLMLKFFTPKSFKTSKS